MVSKYASPDQPRPPRRAACLAIAGTLLLAGCGMLGGNTPKQAMADVEWTFAEDAILIELAADERLNEHDDQPHTLLLGFYQVASADDFRKLGADPDALGRLLESARPDGPVLQGARFVVAPGQRAILSLDRAAKARAVGIVAGYYRADARASARVFEIPLAIARSGIVSSTYSAQPQPLAIRLTLGAAAIQAAERLNPEPLETQRARAAARPRQLVPLDGGGREIPLDAEGAGGGPLRLKD